MIFHCFCDNNSEAFRFYLFSIGPFLLNFYDYFIRYFRRICFQAFFHTFHKSHFLSISFMICFCHIFFFVWLSSTCGTSPETVQLMEYSLLPWGHLDAFSTGVTWTAVISHHHIFIIFKSFVALPTLPFFWVFFLRLSEEYLFNQLFGTGWNAVCLSSLLSLSCQLRVDMNHEWI